MGSCLAQKLFCLLFIDVSLSHQPSKELQITVDGGIKEIESNLVRHQFATIFWDNDC